MVDRRLRNLWNSLLVRKPHMPHFLTGAGLTGIRGCDSLWVRFHYPVSVIVGENGSGQVNGAFCCRLRIQGARCGREGIRSVHAFSRLPTEIGQTWGPKGRNHHRVGLFDTEGFTPHAVAAHKGLESQFRGPEKCHPAGAPGLFQGFRQSCQPIRTARCAGYVTHEIRAAGIAIDGISNRICAAIASL